MNDSELMGKIQERQACCQERDKQDQRVRDLSLEISTEMALRGTKRVEAGEWQAVQVDSERKNPLTPQILLQAGASKEVIEKAINLAGVGVMTSLRVSRRVGG